MKAYAVIESRIIPTDDYRGITKADYIFTIPNWKECNMREIYNFLDK